MSTSAQNTSYQALYRSCMKEAAAQGRTLMQRLVGRAGMSMPQRGALAPDAQERALLTDAARTLMKHEGALCEAYPQALLAEFALAISGDTRKPTVLSFDSLELMGDDQVQEGVELVRTQHTVTTAVEAELAQLNALICAVQGLNTVQVDRNPLRPETYVRSLRAVTLQSPVPSAVRARWMQHLGEALGIELARVYQELCLMLRSQGVVEAGFHALPSTDPAPGRPAGGPVAEAGTLLTVKELRRLLSGEFDRPQTGNAEPEPARETAPAEFSFTVPAALETLQEMKQVDKVMQRLQQRQGQGSAEGAAGDGRAALREQLRKEARGPGQALGLEVVNLMVENIAGDSRLLAPVQQAVRELEPALLRLALTDPRFFSDRKHPARQLLEEMTQRSLAWSQADAPGFTAFLDPLQQAVDALLTTQIEGAEPFEFALRSLQEAWGDQLQRDRRYREKAVRALLQAEQRNLLAERIGKDLRTRPDVAGAPREVSQFIAGPWSQVLAQARLSDPTGSSDPGGYAALVSDLLWSAQPRLVAGQPARLVKLVPPLVEKLRQGLGSIDYPLAESRRFLDQLIEMHRQALKPPAEISQAAPLPPALTRQELEAQFGGESDSGDDGDAWLAPSEAQDSDFISTHQSAVHHPLYQATQPGSSSTSGQLPTADAAPVILPPSSLQPGAWVELLMGSGWARFQLTWASPHGTLFMFTNAAGKAQSMTRRLLDKMLQGGTLRLISGQGVVDGALDAVANSALRNSLDARP